MKRSFMPFLLMLFSTVSVAASTNYVQTLTSVPEYVLSKSAGGGPNDLQVSGLYTSTADHTYDVVIDSVSGPYETFKWRKDSGSYNAGIAIVGGFQSLSDGVKVSFAQLRGHPLNDAWHIVAQWQQLLNLIGPTGSSVLSIDNTGALAIGALVGPLSISGGDLTVNTVKVGEGGGNIGTNVIVGSSNALINNTTGLDNTALGNATLVNNTTGHDDTAVGQLALRFNTIGQFNTAVGVQALYSNTTAGNNTAVGANALRLTTTGDQNTAVGVDVLKANTTGQFNIGVGAEVLQSNTTGIDNVGMGYNALQLNTTGNKNVAVGPEALIHTDAADYNAGFGYQAGDGNTSGTRNTAVGASALYLQQTGNDNTAMGRFAANGAAQYSSTGLVAIGANSLFNVRSGSDNNTAIGFNSGLTLSTGTSNTLLGRASDVSGSGDINSIVIGDSAVGLGSNTVVLGNSSTAHTYLKGAIHAPSTVAATGAITGSNLSGTNTGDQTISLTGNVTGSGTGSFATTIASGAVIGSMLASNIAISTSGNIATTGSGTIAASGAISGSNLSGTNTGDDVAGTGILQSSHTTSVDQSASLTWTGNTTFSPSGTNAVTVNGDTNSPFLLNSVGGNIYAEFKMSTVSPFADLIFTTNSSNMPEFRAVGDLNHAATGDMYFAIDYQNVRSTNKFLWISKNHEIGGAAVSLMQLDEAAGNLQLKNINTSLVTCNSAAVGTQSIYRKGSAGTEQTAMCVCVELAGAYSWQPTTSTGSCT